MEVGSDRDTAIAAAANAEGVRAHTPGPWAVHCSYAHDARGCDEPHRFAIYTDDGRGNGFPIPCREDDRDAEIALANARLIAAAPELLEALESVLRADTPWTTKPTADDLADLLADLRATARAAIAKAEGA